jgi:hypothetical protein
MGSVRFLDDMELIVNKDGQDMPVKINAGDIYGATSITVDSDGYSDISLKDGRVFMGVLSSLFENMGNKVKCIYVEEVEPPNVEEFTNEDLLDLNAEEYDEPDASTFRGY